MTERQVQFESEGRRLSGTVTLPDAAERRPAVLLICGSGQLDRDESAPQLRMDAFRQIAAHLGEHGFGSLRFDKRGVGKSEGNFWETGFSDNVVDAHAALNCLRSQAGVEPGRVFVLGHSEGASIAMRLAGGGADMAGAILLAGTAHSGEECLVWQAARIVEGLRGFNKWLIQLLHIDVLKSQRKALDKIKKTKKNCIRLKLIKKLNAKWFREFLAYDPAQDLARMTVPVLAITGSKDIQVNPEDLKVMAKLIPGSFEFQEIPDVTHLLRAEPGEPSIATYKQQVKRPLDARLLRVVVDWLERTAAVGPPA
ncbi:MAG TPA: alpha/beta fold hydrolase [Candidatus Acidoferrales bacterium]|nr:alpha/beta fold hydrolase [Candidatus Acidoferrales bacterium]